MAGPCKEPRSLREYPECTIDVIRGRTFLYAGQHLLDLGLDVHLIAPGFTIRIRIRDGLCGRCWFYESLSLDGGQNPLAAILVVLLLGHVGVARVHVAEGATSRRTRL